LVSDSMNVDQPSATTGPVMLNDTRGERLSAGAMLTEPSRPAPVQSPSSSNGHSQACPRVAAGRSSGPFPDARSSRSQSFHSDMKFSDLFRHGGRPAPRVPAGWG